MMATVRHVTSRDCLSGACEISRRWIFVGLSVNAQVTLLASMFLVRSLLTYAHILTQFVCYGL
jgi:hypothetical protein